MLQIGTRNMANFGLLQAVGEAGKPVLLKRGMTATIEEWLMAAEYIAQRGNLDVVLCERGIRTFEPATRNTLDISAVPVVQAASHLPIIVDPSHAAGRKDLVVPLSRAAIAVGADGVIVDVHPDPETALCDGPQALQGTELRELAQAVRRLPPVVGRVDAAEPGPGSAPADCPPSGRRADRLRWRADLRPEGESMDTLRECGHELGVGRVLHQLRPARRRLAHRHRRGAPAVDCRRPATAGARPGRAPPPAIPVVPPACAVPPPERPRATRCTPTRHPTPPAHPDAAGTPATPGHRSPTTAGTSRPTRRPAAGAGAWLPVGRRSRGAAPGRGLGVWLFDGERRPPTRPAAAGATDADRRPRADGPARHGRAVRRPVRRGPSGHGAGPGDRAAQPGRRRQHGPLRGAQHARRRPRDLLADARRRQRREIAFDARRRRRR